MRPTKEGITYTLQHGLHHKVVISYGYTLFKCLYCKKKILIFYLQTYSKGYTAYFCLRGTVAAEETDITVEGICCRELKCNGNICLVLKLFDGFLLHCCPCTGIDVVGKPIDVYSMISRF